MTPTASLASGGFEEVKGKRALFSIQVVHTAPRVVKETSEVTGRLGDAVSSLTLVPQQYLDKDKKCIHESDRFDNAVTSYGPDEDGHEYCIVHSRTLSAGLRHTCQAIAEKRRVKHGSKRSKIKAFRIVATRPGTHRQIPVFTKSCEDDTQSAGLWDHSDQALSTAESYKLPEIIEEACNLLASDAGVLRALAAQCEAAVQD